MIEAALLGPPELRCGGRAVPLPTRKALALVAYLALEGRTSRAVLAELLWPDAGGGQARGHLRRELHRLRQTPLGTLLAAVAGDVALGPGLTCDVSTFRAQAEAGRLDEALALWRGEPLAGFGLPGAPAFEEWLGGQRERLAGLRQDLLRRRAEALEAAGELRPALAQRLELLRADELTEAHHREVMRLHALLGERAAALRQFERLRQVLADELGLAPLPETLRLAREIGRRTVPRPVPPGPPPLHPPALVGREREWAQMEAAWAAGQPIYITGEPGVGKTRLMLDFAASKGACEPNDGRPGDAGLPYASLARGLRGLLERQPELRGQLPAWVRQELSRLLPELGDARPPPLRVPEDRRRLLDAGLVLLGLGTRDRLALTTDDLHLFDPLSFEAGAYFTGSPALPLRVLVTFRRDELPPVAWQAVREQVDAGRALLLELEPLSVEALAELLEELDLPTPPAGDLAGALHRYTGGNPLFVLETVRHLLGTGELARGLPEHLPPPGRVRPIIARRLEHLPQGAARLAQVAAVAGEDFSLDLAGRVLGTDPLDLAPVLGRLEQDGLLRGERFAHDLLRDGVLASLPGPVRHLLHARVLAALGEGARVAVRARHAVAAGVPQAHPLSLAAAAEATHLLAPQEALGHLGQALSFAPTDRDAFDIYWARLPLWLAVGDRVGWTQDLAALDALAVRLDDPELARRVALAGAGTQPADLP
ncbi:DNA-binding SARP family transcriptional activator [Deinococcus sp. HSC-46F16]|uniref:BTAD domain-containing putative transcriptional regulator n=1 Tax=Deinococcus sp. HSC-46F16 TaxID=2910968 RepID=UPI0020A031AD|nr:BTAD domain-containing putative transcriptional regulator [Deinococcus sp. HSC-46F16]MCP2013201.1 DNA-binding SARP family transcriptional activator [Deinococcus sp. HSC-46F16]